jgi:hypothetical protein
MDDGTEQALHDSVAVGGTTNLGAVPYVHRYPRSIVPVAGAESRGSMSPPAPVLLSVRARPGVPVKRHTGAIDTRTATSTESLAAGLVDRAASNSAGPSERRFKAVRTGRDRQEGRSRGLPALDDAARYRQGETETVMVPE